MSHYYKIPAKPVEIKQVRSTSFCAPPKPYERRQSQQLAAFNQTFECKTVQQTHIRNDNQTSCSTSQDIQDTHQSQSQPTQILQALEQQIQINQLLETQVNQLQSQLQQMQQKSEQNHDIHHVLDQLNIYKSVVEQLELKIKEVINENCKLNDANQQFAEKEYYLKEEIYKYQQIMENNMHQEIINLSSNDIQKKMRQIVEENALLQLTNTQLEKEIAELRIGIEQFKQSVVAFKHSYRNDTESDRQSYTLELENQIQHLQHMTHADYLKMQALEEKLNLLTRENSRLMEQLMKTKRK